jgi:hypothetical protein
MHFGSLLLLEIGIMATATTPAVLDHGLLLLLLPAEVAVPRKELLDLLFPQEQQILLLVFVLTGLGNLFLIVLATDYKARDKGRAEFLP